MIMTWSNSDGREIEVRTYENLMSSKIIKKRKTPSNEKQQELGIVMCTNDKQ